jgi:hypothetical protein
MRVTAEDADTRRLTFLQKVGICGYYERTGEPNMGKTDDAEHAFG